MGTVSTLSIIGMCFSFIVSIGVPIGLMIYAFKKLNARLIWFVIGALTFVLFALILEQLLHYVMVSSFGEALTGNIFLMAVYGGLAAGIFEEVGRFVSMNLFKKKALTKQNAFMYGVGHGGIEAILIVGITSISNLVISMMINQGTFEATLSALDPQVKEQTMAQISLLWSTNPLDFYLGGVERICAIVLHICLSIIVYKAVKEHKIYLLFLSITIHALVDCITVIMAAYLSGYMIELVLVIVITIIAVTVYKKYSEDIDKNNETLEK